MFAKGPMPGYSPKAEVLAHFPDAQCSRFYASGINGYVVKLPNGKQIGTGGSAAQAWKNVRIPDGVNSPAGVTAKEAEEALRQIDVHTLPRCYAPFVDTLYKFITQHAAGVPVPPSETKPKETP